MSKVVMVTDAASSVGKAACKALAIAGHVVYASIYDTAGLKEQIVR
jgi:NAD(P)-dependent dehydrogenase (short-subunit alcohol dehydrogenase family)